METTPDSTIIEIPSEYPKDLNWSLRPIIFSMQMMGIDLNLSTTPSKFRQCGFIVLGLAFQIYILVSIFIFKGERKYPIDFKSTIGWLEFLEEYLYSVWNVLFPLVVFEMMTLIKWKSLWKTMMELEQFMNFQATFYRQLRKVCILLVCIPSILVIILYQMNFSSNFKIKSLIQA